MPDYILLMHNDVITEVTATEWSPYLEKLQAAGALQGGSAIGDGECVRRDGAPAKISRGITGFIRIEAGNLDDAKSLLTDNPVYEAGGTVEIRELPRTA